MTTQHIEGATFKPADPNYSPSFSLEEQLRPGSLTGGVAELAVGDTETFVDNGTDRWHYVVTSGKPNFLTLQLQVGNQVTWWKQIVVSSSMFGSWFQIRTLGTKDDNRIATVDLSPSDAQSGTLKLDFWKGGVFGLGAYITTMIVDVQSNLGNQITYLCDRPIDRQ